jgi:hypothetical protein
MGKKQRKSKPIPFTFRPFLATFPIFHKRKKKREKGNALAFTFRPFLATFQFS